MADLRGIVREARALTPGFQPADAPSLCMRCFVRLCTQMKAQADAIVQLQLKCPEFLDALMRFLMVERDYSEASRTAMSKKMALNSTRCAKCPRMELPLHVTSATFEILYTQCAQFALRACLDRDRRVPFGGRHATWPASPSQLFPFDAARSINALITASDVYSVAVALVGGLLSRHRPLVFPEMQKPCNRLRLLQTIITLLRQFVDRARPVLEPVLRTSGPPAPGARDALLGRIAIPARQVTMLLHYIAFGQEATVHDTISFARGFENELYVALVDTIACFETPESLFGRLPEVVTDLFRVIDAAHRQNPPDYVRELIVMAADDHHHPYRNLWAVAPEALRQRSCHGCGRPVHDSSTGKAFPRCGKCKVAQYCSAECQRKDWKEGMYPHKTICDILNELFRFATFERTKMSIDEFAAACQEHAFPPDRAILLADWMCAATGIKMGVYGIPAPYQEVLTNMIDSEREMYSSRRR